MMNTTMGRAVYPVLHSGYVAADTQRLRKPQSPDASLQQLLISKMAKDPLYQYYYNEEVDKIYSRWNGDRNLIKDIDFRESVLVAAFRSFGMKSFYQWLVIQQNKPKYSQMHSRFLLETLAYVFNGTPRTIQVVQWIALLTASERTNRVMTDLKPWFPPSTNGLMTGTNSTALVDLLPKWVSQPGGFEDLLVTLNVIFGSRSSGFSIVES